MDKSRETAASGRQTYRTFWRAAWIGCAVVLGLGYALEICAALQGKTSADLHWELFRLDSEGNVPSAYSVLLEFSVAILMFMAAVREFRLGRRTALGWTVLGFIFVILSLDDLFGLHEALNKVKAIPQFGGLLHFRWVLVGTAIVAVTLGVFLPFLLRIPRITAKRLFIAGAVFVFAAVGLEMVAGLITEQFGQKSLAYTLEFIIEESLENIGMLLAFRAVLLHLYEVLPATALSNASKSG